MFWIIQNGNDWYLVDVPKSIANEGWKYHDMFEKYVHDPKNGFFVWMDIYRDGNFQQGVCYGIKDFISWLNDTILRDSEEKVIVISNDDDKVSELSINKKYHLLF